MNRRHLLLLPPLGVLAACAATPPPAPEGPEISYAYLPRLRLNVASIDIDENRPNAGPTDVGRDLRPGAAEAVQIMGRDRLAAFGTENTARFVTLRAAILRERQPSQGGLFGGDPGERLNCTLTCRLEIRGANDLRLGFAEATVNRTAPSESSVAARNRTATSLLRRATFDLNTEFEFQLRRALRDWLVEGERAAPPAPGGVVRESL
jgi:hypothetical protein